MKSILRISLLTLFAFAGLPSEAEACCTDSTLPQYQIDQSHQDHRDAPCDDSSCHCICCGTISMVCWNQLLVVSSASEDIPTTPTTYTSLVDHLFANAIWQPPKQAISSSITL